MSKFHSIVPYIENRLVKHHQLYSAPCKAEYWEENLCAALRQSGFGSNWKPDFNHKSGKDQTTNAGVRISNKSGTVNLDCVTISGSRLGKHNTIEGKIEFLSIKKEDYIFCLSTEKADWQKDIKRYYFIVIDSDKINYHEQKWIETYGENGSLKDSINGWKCVSEIFSANIRKSMSDQLWTKIKLDYCDEIYEIKIE